MAAAEKQAAFHPVLPLTVHWDEKIILVADGDPAEDHSPALVSGENIDKLLAVSSFPNGTGCVMAEAVLSSLDNWDIRDGICALSFDTTASPERGVAFMQSFNLALTIEDQRQFLQVVEKLCCDFPTTRKPTVTSAK